MTSVSAILTSRRRYLRARKFVPTDAFGQFQDTEDWRKENQIDKLYENIDVQEYDAARRLVGWPGYTTRMKNMAHIDEVPSMDREARSSRHTRLCFRSCSLEQQSRVRVRIIYFQAARRHVESPSQDATAVCALREPDHFCSPAVLGDP